MQPTCTATDWRRKFDKKDTMEAVFHGGSFSFAPLHP
jgi:hypothetical protein